ncbi:MAG: hypothetical protein ACJAYG_001564, partial [Oceanicoccus sp.]
MFKQLPHHLAYLALASSLLLTACGGGGGNGAETPDTIQADELTSSDIAITGSAVKGPIASAIVKLYEIDWTAADLKGPLIGTGSTNAEAQIQDLTINTQRQNPKRPENSYLIEFEGGTDLTNNAPTIIPVLKTIFTFNFAGELNNPTVELPTIYATPLSTFAVEVVAARGVAGNDTNGDGIVFQSEITIALDEAQDLSKAIFGLGILNSNIDFFETSPMLSNNTEQAATLNYRTASEVFAAIIDQLDNAGTGTSTEIIQGLAEDIQDGAIDAMNGSESISALSDISNLQAQASDYSGLTVVGTSIPFSDINILLVDEQEYLGTADEVTPDTSGDLATAPVLGPIVLGDDSDGDGTIDANDDCPLPQNNTGTIDTDGDGICDETDAFDNDANETTDSDNDGTGDNSDLFPNNSLESEDSDNDCGTIDTSSDTAGNGCGDNSDAFPFDSDEQLDTDSDTIGDNSDACPSNA